jgi:hypothetical protein
VHQTLLHNACALVFDSGFTLDRFNFHARFQPSLLNTALFVVKAVMEIVTIMQAFSENRMLLPKCGLTSDHRAVIPTRLVPVAPVPREGRVVLRF